MKRLSWRASASAIIFGVAVCLTAVSSADCDPQSPPSPEPSCPGGGLTYWGAAINVVEATITSTNSIEVEGSWNVNGASNCSWVPCDQAGTPAPLEFNWSETKQHCWKVGGSASGTGKAALVNKLFAELGIAVQFNGEFSGCTSITTGLKWSIPGSQCVNRYGRELITTNTVNGKVKEIRTRYQYTCSTVLEDMTISTVVLYSDCGVSESSGWAKNYGRGTQYAPMLPECGGAVSSPDLHDGQRSTPCCRPLSWCGDNIPPGEHECCGCFASQ